MPWSSRTVAQEEELSNVSIAINVICLNNKNKQSFLIADKGVKKGEDQYIRRPIKVEMDSIHQIDLKFTLRLFKT